MRADYKLYISYDNKSESDKNYFLEFTKINKLNIEDQKLKIIERTLENFNIDKNLHQKEIFKKIKREYLLDSIVTIVLVGKNTKNSEKMDLEFGASMINEKSLKKSGIVFIALPGCENIEEFLSERMLKNLKNSNIKIPVLRWKEVGTELAVLNAVIEANEYKEFNRYEF